MKPAVCGRQAHMVKKPASFQAPLHSSELLLKAIELSLSDSGGLAVEMNAVDWFDDTFLSYMSVGVCLGCERSNKK